MAEELHGRRVRRRRRSGEGETAAYEGRRVGPWVVDTNVPIVANGRPDPRDDIVPSPECREAAIEFLESIVESGVILLDDAGDIQREYQKHLSPSGQPGLGDRFYAVVLQRMSDRVRRITLRKRPDGSFEDFPEAAELSRFDKSDRKFAALARRERATVANATDSDWLDFREPLARHGIDVHFICGCDRGRWFTGLPA